MTNKAWIYIGCIIIINNVVVILTTPENLIKYISGITGLLTMGVTYLRIKDL